MRKTADQIELDEFHRACNKVLQEISFDEKLKQEMYIVYKSIERKGNAKICKNCMYCDRIKGVCLSKGSIQETSKKCWNANNIKILKEKGLYGEKRNVKRGID